MNRVQLLSNYFSIDASGNDDGIQEHFVRTNPKLITKSKAHEFKLIMKLLIPSWKEDADLLDTGNDMPFTIIDVAHKSNVLCICTQPITEICYIKHPLLEKSVQVGNTCVGKICLELKKHGKKMHAEKKKRLTKEENDRLDDLVAKVEQEQDEQMELRVKFDALKQRLNIAEYIIMNMKPCSDCKVLKLDNRLRCKPCYAKQ